MENVTAATKLKQLQALLLVLFLCSFANLAAQSRRSELIGMVKDAQGAVVPLAEVTVTHETSGVQARTATNTDGLYRVIDLTPGPYTVSVSTSGFKTFTRQGFTLVAGDIGRLDVT